MELGDPVAVQLSAADFSKRLVELTGCGGDEHDLVRLAATALGADLVALVRQRIDGAYVESCRGYSGGFTAAVADDVDFLALPEIVLNTGKTQTCRLTEPVPLAAAGFPLQCGNGRRAVLLVAYQSRGSIPVDLITFWQDIAVHVGGALTRLESAQAPADNDVRKELARTQQYLDTAGVMLLALDRDGRIVQINRRGCKVLGLPREEILGKDWFATFVPLECAGDVATVFSALSAGELDSCEYHENEIVRPDGGRRLIAWHNAILREGDEFIGLFCSGEDVTEKRAAEAERNALQQQLWQSQKLESVGRLAGGVAHDFNNILTVIRSSAELAQDALEPDHPATEYLDEIRQAAEKSADLTSQLLGFARRQTATPRTLDLNEAVEAMLAMLTRLIGESIALAWQPGANLPPVRIDPVQLHQIIVNVVINARDAIDGTGQVTISTRAQEISAGAAASSAEPVVGRYAVLQIKDDGCGMDTETQAQVFEPFFSARSGGVGTGLGLATVYGITKQNGGLVQVDSAPGRGATFQVMLPATDAVATEDRDCDRTEIALVQGTQTVLMVEDEEAILALGQRMFEKYGYRFLGASLPSKALALAREHPGEIHLLVTDVVMPEMNGRELAEAVQRIYPEIACLYISGYTADIIADQGVLKDDINFVAKPFTMKELIGGAQDVLRTD